MPDRGFKLLLGFKQPLRLHFPQFTVKCPKNETLILAMRALIRQTLVLHFTSHPFPLRRPFNSAAGDDPHRRRAEPYGPSPSPLRRNYDEENRSVKVTVWWDFENCQVPVGVNVERVANRITSALRSTGIKGPIIITAFGDVAQMSRATQEALTSTGVSLNHVPHRWFSSSSLFPPKIFLLEMLVCCHLLCCCCQKANF